MMHKSWIQILKKYDIIEDEKEKDIKVNKKIALHHLFTIHSKKKSIAFKEEMWLLFELFKRRKTKENQEGGGQIKTGESPISFNIYRWINEYIKRTKYRVRISKRTCEYHME